MHLFCKLHRTSQEVLQPLVVLVNLAKKKDTLTANSVARYQFAASQEDLSGVLPVLEAMASCFNSNVVGSAAAETTATTATTAIKVEQEEEEEEVAAAAAAAAAAATAAATSAPVTPFNRRRSPSPFGYEVVPR